MTNIISLDPSYRARRLVTSLALLVLCSLILPSSKALIKMITGADRLSLE